MSDEFKDKESVYSTQPPLPPRPSSQITSQHTPSLYGSLSPEQAQQEYWRNYEEEQRIKEQHWAQYQQQLQQQVRLKIGQEYLLRSESGNSTPTATRLPFALPPSHVSAWYTQTVAPQVTPPVQPIQTQTNPTQSYIPTQSQLVPQPTKNPTLPTQQNTGRQTQVYPPPSSLYPSLYPAIQPLAQQQQYKTASIVYTPSSAHPYSQVVSPPASSSTITRPLQSTAPVPTTTTTNTIMNTTTTSTSSNTTPTSTIPSYLRTNSRKSTSGIHNWQVFAPTPSPLASEVALHNSNIHSSNTDQQALTTLNKFKNILNNQSVDLGLLSSLAITSGIPAENRAVIWQLLLGYLPPNKSQRISTLRTQRSEYLSLVQKQWTKNGPIACVPSQRVRLLGTWAEYDQMQKNYFNTDKSYSLMTKEDFQLHHLVSIDVARTRPTGFVKLFSNPRVSESLERILYIWSQQNKDIGYFQGLADITTPFFLVYLTSCFGPISDAFNEYDANTNILSDDVRTYLPAVEADTYWSLCILMNNLRQDHPFNHGAAHAEAMMSEFFIIMDKIDSKLMEHLVNVGLELICFALRWMLCLMTREFTTKNIIHLWDAYVAEKQGFSKFHIYICGAFLQQLGPTLMATDDLGKCMHIVLRPPTQYWDANNVNHLIQQARILREKYPLQ